MSPLSDQERLERLSSLRKKIEQLNRAPVRHVPPPCLPTAPAPPPSGPGVKPVVISRRVPVFPASPVPGRPSSGLAAPARLEDCVEGRECSVGPGPPFYLVENSVSEVEPAAATLLDRVRRACSVMGTRGIDRAEEGGPVPPERLCLFDLETTGLSSSPVFLAGLLLVRDGELICRQLLARTYAEERSIVAAFAEIAGRSDMYVSFNGKTFDVPFMRARAAATGVRLPDVARHFDLLHACRRVYRGRLPDCRLQTLERHVCGRHRGHDVPGSEIPQVYHDYVRSGDARVIVDVLRHNMFDLITLADLMVRVLLSGTTEPDG